ncbi:Hsp20/alpha crystallin family protein [Streptomyces olivaceoviridis]
MVAWFPVWPRLLRAKGTSGPETWAVRPQRYGPPEDIDVFISDGILTVQPERSEKDVTKSHSEIRYGAMIRSVTLPPGADEDDVKADYIDGMPTVSVGLGAEKAEAKHVEIRHGN